MIRTVDFLLDDRTDPFKLLSILPPSLRSRIQIAAEPHPELGTPCWLWTGRLNRNGYGRACIDGKEPVAHRATFELLRGVIPPKRILDHQCRVRHCVNPWHTEPVTHRVNTLRGNAILFQPPEMYLTISGGHRA